MYHEISQLLMYGDLSSDEILYNLGVIFDKFESGNYSKMELVRDINTRLRDCSRWLQITALTTISGTIT